MTFSRFRNLSISRKLAVIIIFSCLLVSLLTSALFVGLEITSLRRSMVEDLSGLARVIGISCIAPLEFMDSDTATEVLSSLSARPHIRQAVLYSQSGQVFAHYLASSVTSDEVKGFEFHVKQELLSHPEESYHFHKAFIDLSLPINAGDKLLGQLVLQADKDEFYAILIRLVYAVVGIICVTLLLAFYFSSILNKVVSWPILSLAGTVQRVHSEQDYSIRAEKASGDELAVLVDGVNSMLTGIEERDEQLLVAKKAAENANVAKSKFLAQMSHEIRTPMNGVLGISSLLLHTQLDKKQSHFVHTIRNSGESLLNLINDILDFSKIEAGKLELERVQFNLRNMAEETVELLSQQADDKNVNLACLINAVVPAEVIGDPGRLRQILMNLIGNALKFTSYGEVLLYVSEEKRIDKDVHLRFEVRDSGIGIRKEKQKDIFTAFSQADDSTTREYGGTGLGLAICRQLVAMMGGTIGVESAVGEGSIFWFTTVFKIGDGRGLTIDTGHETIIPKNFDLSILVVEDNITNQIVAQGTLEKYGCEVELADNGLESLEAVKKEQYDLVFMDCQMPVMDGYEATENIRRLEQERGTRRVPIIALTAHALKGDRERCLAVGMDDYITKPFNEKQLASILFRWSSSQKGNHFQSVEREEQKEKVTDSEYVHIDKNVIDNLVHILKDRRSDSLESLILVYLENGTDIVQKLPQFLANNDYENIWQSAHSLQSSSANFGASQLAALCMELEAAGKEARIGVLPTLIQSIETEFSMVAKELKEYYPADG